MHSGRISFHEFARAVNTLLQGSDKLVLGVFEAIVKQCEVSLPGRAVLCFEMLGFPPPCDGAHFGEDCFRPGVFPVPLGSMALRQFVRTRCGVVSPPFNPFRLPSLDGGVVSHILKKEHLFALACSSTNLQQPSWTRLFSLAEQGTNFDFFCDQLIGYAGPTVICVLDDVGRRFGLVAIEPWALSPTFSGSGAGCFLFVLGDGSGGGNGNEYNALRPRARGAVPHYQYLNTKDFRSEVREL